MALVKYGGGIVQMSGSMAGNTYARNRSGNYVRSRTKPVNPNSDRQVTARVNISYLAEYWHEELNAVQRGLWDTYAAAIVMMNNLGEAIHLTGFNHFIRTNGAHMIWSGVVLPNAPSVLSLPEKDNNLIISEESIAAQQFNFQCDDDGWAVDGDTKLMILLYQGRPQLASRNFFGGPWRYMGIINATEGALGTATRDASFSFALGQKVWIKARLMTISGRLTEPWNLAPRTIEADP